MHDARALCQAAGVRLTPIREQVLRLIWQSHRPLGAYDLLAELGHDGRPAAPPTVYRALDFLQAQGLVHRIASLNAFIGCPHPGESHAGVFLICTGCRNVLELPLSQIGTAIETASQSEGFRVDQLTIEVSGLCPACQADEARRHV